MPMLSKSGLVILGLLSGAYAMAQPTVPFAGLTEVQEILNQQPLVRVIATLAPTESGRELRGAELLSAQSSIETMMRDAGAALVSPIEGQPLVVLELDRTALDRLVASGQVVSIQEDRLGQAHLAESTVLVRAPEALALGAGGQGEAIAVLDSGVDGAHPFLAGKVVDEACFSSSSVAFGATTVCPNGQPSDTGAGAAQPCTIAVVTTEPMSRELLRGGAPTSQG